MKLNIYKFWLASSFSLCYLLAPKTVTAQEIFLPENNYDQHQQITVDSVISITKKLNIDFTINATYVGKTTNNPKHNVAITNSKNADLEPAESKARTGLEAKGGKPPRKG